jgi:flavodoxin
MTEILKKLLEIWKSILNLLETKEFWYFFIPTVCAFIIYYLSVSTKNEKKYVFVLFKANQKLSLKIQRNLQEFIEKHDAYNAIAFPEKNLSYGNFLEQTKVNFLENLSDEQYDILFKNRKKLTKPILVATIESLKTQNENLRLMDIDIQMVMRKADEMI